MGERSDPGAPPTRLVIVNGSPFPSAGGIQTFTAALAREAARVGVPVEIVATTSGADAAVERTAEGTIRRVRALPALDGRLPVPHPVSLARTLAATLRGPTALVVVQARFYLTSPVVVACATLARHRVCVVDHGSAHIPLDSRALARIGDAYEHVVTAAIRLFRPRFYGVSPASVAWLRHFGIRDAGLLPNAVDDALFTRGRPHGPRAIPTIVYSGRLIRQKGLLELARAVRLLAARGVRARTVVLGDGPLRDELVAATRDLPDVDLRGAVPHATALDVMAEADIVVSPSLRPEGYCVAALEAGALGRALVATPDGAATLVEDGRTGALLHDVAPEPFADALERLCRDAELRRAHGAAIRAEAARRLVWSAVLPPFFAREGLVRPQSATIVAEPPAAASDSWTLTTRVDDWTS